MYPHLIPQKRKIVALESVESFSCVGLGALIPRINVETM